MNPHLDKFALRVNIDALMHLSSLNWYVLYKPESVNKIALLNSVAVSYNQNKKEYFLFDFEALNNGAAHFRYYGYLDARNEKYIKSRHLVVLEKPQTIVWEKI